MTNHIPNQVQANRFEATSFIARTRILRVLATLCVLVMGLAGSGLAQINEPPAAPYSILAFPERDFVSTSGYADATETLTVQLLRNGSVVNTVGPTNPIIDPKAGPVFEVNHPGTGLCWTGSVPFLRPGDQVRQTVTNATGTLVNQTTIQDMTVGRPTNPSPGVIEVHGTAQAADGGPLPLAEIEQRIIANKSTFIKNGRRTLRAAAGADGTLAYDPINPDTNPIGIKWTARYTGLVQSDIDQALAAESRIMWLGVNPAALSEQTIVENNPGVVFHGPSIPPCTAGILQEPLDTQAPTIPSGVTATANGRTVSLSWTASTDDVAVRYYNIYRDTNAASGKPQLIKTVGAGVTTFTDNNVATGDHTYYVEATDAARNVSGVSAGAPVTIGAVVPTIDNKPPSPTKINQGLTFAFSSTTAGATFQCSLSAGADQYAPCTSPISYGTAASPVPDGSYTFKVVAVDPANPGLVSPPTTAALVVDTVAPAVSLDTKPTNPTNNKTPSFAFSSTDPTAKFQCALGPLTSPPALAACTSPVTASAPLADGSYTFQVQATDPAGNVSPLTVYNFNVSTTAPTVTLGTKPPALSNNASPTFTFSSTATGATFECSLVTSGSTLPSFQPNCTSPFTPASPLADGSYDFTVRVTDTAGNTGTSTPYTFAVDSKAPTVAASPAGGTFNKAQNITLTATDASATSIFYTLDGSTPTSASTKYTAPIAITTTPAAGTTVKYIAIDGAGNASAVGSQTYIIDAAAPVVTASPAGGIFSAAQSVTLTANKTGSSIFYTLDGSAPTTSSTQYTAPIALALNKTTTVSYIGVDSLGNQSTPASQSYTIDTLAPATPTASPAGGTFGGTQNVTLASTDNLTGVKAIFYTTDGSDPKTSATAQQYAGAITIPASPTPTTTTLTFYAVDGAGNASGLGTQSYTIDGVAPTVTITPLAKNPTNATSGTIAFTSSKAGSTFACTFGPTGGAATISGAACSSPFGYGPLTTNGSYTLSVTATDTAGNKGTSSYAFVLDTVAPTVTASPAGGTFTGAQSVTLALGAGEPASTQIRYTLGPAGTAAPTPTTGTVYAGPISVSSTATLQYIAVDAAGNASAVGSQAYTINTPLTATSTTISAPAVTSPNNATVTVTVSATGATPTGNVSLSMDGGAAQSAALSAQGTATFTITSPAVGTHTLNASYAAQGNFAASTGSGSLVVNAASVAPTVTITAGPAAVSNNANPSFSFTSNQTATFQCSLVLSTAADSFSACASPKAYTAVASGLYNFKVIATNASGQSSTAAVQQFRVDTVAPTATAPTRTLITPQQLTSNTVPVRLSWTGADTNGSGIARYDMEKSFNAGAFTAVTLPAGNATAATVFLSPGNNQIRVRAVDAAGNVGAWATMPTFNVGVPSDASATYTGTWSTLTVTGAFGGTVRSTSTTGNTAKITFTGSSVGFVAPKGPNLGVAQILIDGVSAGTVDLYAATASQRQLVFVRNGLSTTTTHTITVRVNGTKNASSTGTRVDVDGFVVLK